MKKPKDRKLTQSVESRICRALKFAVSLRIAAESADVSNETVKSWMQRGETGEEPYASFVAAVNRARMEAVKNLTDIALGGGKGAANAEWLYLHRYGPSAAQFTEGNAMEHNYDENLTNMAVDAAIKMMDGSRYCSKETSYEAEAFLLTVFRKAHAGIWPEEYQKWEESIRKRLEDEVNKKKSPVNE
jgi:hypothetical protein